MKMYSPETKKKKLVTRIDLGSEYYYLKSETGSRNRVSNSPIKSRIRFKHFSESKQN